MAYALAILALILLVVLHELGHFLAARAVGIRATKFYVFFPPAIFRRQVGDVEYGIGAIPAGGFVKLPGMFRPEAGEVAERLRYEFEEVLPHADGDTRLQLDAARRAVAHAGDPDALLEPLGRVRDGIDGMLAAAPGGELERTLRAARGRVVGMLDDAHPQAYWRAALWRRMTVIFAGPLVNIVVAFVVLAAFYWVLSPRYEIVGSIPVATVSQDSPAEEAGLDAGSRITAWNGEIVGLTPDELDERIAAGRGEPADVRWIDGDGDEQRATIVPRHDGDGERLIGIRVGLDEESLAVAGRRTTDPVFGMRVALEEMRAITVGTFTRLPRVFFDSEVREDVGSVVGIVQVADEVDRAGQFVRYVAIISLILAVMNLLPLLPLDGGHLLFGLLEAARRRPMPRAAFERYSLVGLVLVLILFFIGLDNDLTRARSG